MSERENELNGVVALLMSQMKEIGDAQKFIHFKRQTLFAPSSSYKL